MMRRREWLAAHPVVAAGLVAVGAMAAVAEEPAKPDAPEQRETRASAELLPKTAFMGTRLGAIKVKADELAGVTVSPNGAWAVAVCGKPGEQYALLLDGGSPLTDELFFSIKPPVFSPDSRRVAYLALRTIEGNSLGLVSVGPGLGVAHDNVVESKADAPKQTFLVLGSREAEGKMGWRIISPGGTEAGYRAGKSPQGPVKTFLSLAKRVTSSEGQRIFERGEVELLGPPVFSPEGSRIALTVRRETRERLLSGPTDGDGSWEVGESFDRIEGIVFSPDGAHLAYQAHWKTKTLVVLDGRVSEPLDGIMTPLAFDSTSRRLLFGARIDTVLWWESVTAP